MRSAEAVLVVALLGGCSNEPAFDDETTTGQPPGEAAAGTNPPKLDLGNDDGTTTDSGTDTDTDTTPPDLPPDGLPSECDQSILPAGIPLDCFDTIVEFAAQALPVTSDDDLAALCSRLRAATDYVIDHSSEEVSTPSGDLVWTLFKARMYMIIAETQFAADARPCGAGVGYLSLCAEPPSGLAGSAPLPALEDGPALLAAGVLAGEIPLDDPTQHAQFGFVFETDGDPANDWAPLPPFTSDFFGGTDTWYTAVYDPATGWTMTASRIESGAIVTFQSDARIVLEGATIYAIIPLTELGGDCPRGRFTAFAHGGDFGLEPPNVWSGDLEDPVDQPLLTTCR